jgi:hypothetical protein
MAQMAEIERGNQPATSWTRLSLDQGIFIRSWPLKPATTSKPESTETKETAMLDLFKTNGSSPPQVTGVSHDAPQA